MVYTDNFVVMLGIHCRAVDDFWLTRQKGSAILKATPIKVAVLGLHVNKRQLFWTSANTNRTKADPNHSACPEEAAATQSTTES